MIEIEFGDGIELYGAPKVQRIFIGVDTRCGRNEPTRPISASAKARSSSAPFSTRTLFVVSGNSVRGKSSRKKSRAV